MFTIEHILLSLLFNGVVLIAVLFLKSAPPRVVLYVCLAGMLSIIVPWSHIGEGLEQYASTEVVFGTAMPGAASAFASAFATAFAPAPALFEIENRSLGTPLAIVWFAVGLFWLFASVVRSIYTKRVWRTNALCGKELAIFGDSAFQNTLRRVRIYRMPTSSRVFATGMWRPEIWIGGNLSSVTQIEAALNHELAHIDSNDQIVLFIIVALERLLWWNPLIWLLGRQARLHMEYACDSRCQSLIGPALYRQSLAELFLVQQTRSNSFELTLGNKSDIINRMEKIGMKHILKPKHVITIFIAGLLTAIGSASFATPGSSETRTLIQCHELLPEGVQYNFSIDSAIDTREGQKGNLRVALVDTSKPNSTELPEGAGDFLQCVQKVVGTEEEVGWPKT